MWNKIGDVFSTPTQECWHKRIDMLPIPTQERRYENYNYRAESLSKLLIIEFCVSIPIFTSSHAPAWDRDNNQGNHVKCCMIALKLYIRFLPSHSLRAAWM
jgi:hypothetical protein